MHKIFLTLLALFLLSKLSLCQTGIFYFKSSNKYFPNTQIVDIVNDQNKNIIVVCSNTDENFRTSTLSTYTIKSNGELKSTKNHDQGNIYDIVKIIEVGKGVYSIYGNTTLNKELNPFTINIDDNHHILSVQNSKTVYSTNLADIYALNSSNALAIYTRKGKDNRFGIEISKLNTGSKNVAWFKKLNETQNEEANDIMVTHNDDVYVLGKTFDSSLKDYSPVLYKLNENGEIIWRKLIEVPTNFNNHSISADKTGNAVYVCGYTRNQTGGIESRLIKLNNDGKPVKTKNLKNFSTNGIMKMSNGNFLLYGSTFYVNFQQVVTKGKYIIVDQDLNLISTHSLTIEDKPDSELNGSYVTSSELLTAYELEDDRIAIGGKVYMPVNESDLYNQPLLIICSQDGEYK